MAVILTTGFYTLRWFQKAPTYCGSWDVAVTLSGCLFLIVRLSSFPIQNISQDKTFKKFLYIRYTALPPGSVDLKPFFQGLYTCTLSPRPLLQKVVCEGKRGTTSWLGIQSRKRLCTSPSTSQTSFLPYKVGRHNILRFGFWCSVEVGDEGTAIHPRRGRGRPQPHHRHTYTAPWAITVLSCI